MTEADFQPGEILYWLEFGCWTVVALTPFLYWVNGPAVSPDQLVVRTALVVLALGGGVGLRLFKLIRRKRRTEAGKRLPSSTDISSQ